MGRGLWSCGEETLMLDIKIKSTLVRVSHLKLLSERKYIQRIVFYIYGGREGGREGRREGEQM